MHDSPDVTVVSLPASSHSPKNLAIVISTADALKLNNDKNDAKKMLKQFAGLSHEVITSVGFLTSKNFEILTEVTEVTYKDLNEKEINYYVDTVNPIDKAGSYGIQDWIGMIGVERIKGSYTSVLGLPVPQVTGQILKIINENL